MSDDIGDKLLAIFDPAGSCLYHYTTLEAFLEEILPTGRIKMNPFSKMRDPRESKTLNPIGAVGSSGSATVESSRRFAAIHQKSHRVKDQVKVLSLVRDAVSPRGLENAIFSRGFAHPRLWEQYANQHRGVCLCFDQAKLTGLMTAELAKYGEPEHGEVIYRDGTIEPTAFTFALSDVEKYSDDEIIDRMIRAGMRELFFTKVMDWASESEYRFVVPTRSNEPLYVPVSSALRAVVLGEFVSPAYTPSMTALLDQPGVKELGVRVIRARWQDGGPFLRDPLAPGHS